MSSKKNDSRIRRYVPTQKPEEMEMMNFLTMVCSFGGVFMRNIVLLWVGVFLLISVLCRRRNTTSIFQYLATIVMLGFGMFTLYSTFLRAEAIAVY